MVVGVARVLGGGGGGGRTPFLGELLQNHAVFDPNSLYTPNFGPQIGIFLAFAPPFQNSENFALPFQKSAYGPAYIYMYIYCLVFAGLSPLKNYPQICK